MQHIARNIRPFLQRCLWMTICYNISLCQKFVSGMDHKHIHEFHKLLERPTISLKSRKLAPILTKFVITYLLRAFSSLICRYYHAQVVPKSCHKLSCDSYSHWHNISIYLDVFCEINFAKITHFEVHKSCNTLHEILDLFCKDFDG